MSFKKCQVVMLSTIEKALIYTDRHSNLKVHSTESTLPIDAIGANQHLYILSDEEIKEGDWFINPKPGYKPKQFKEKTEWDGISSAKCYKIIATTNKSLKIKNAPFQGYNLPDSILPQPSQSFIEKYIEEYNKSNIITEVLVEYNIGNWTQETNVHRKCVNCNTSNLKIDPYNCECTKLPKVDFKDNTVTIRKIKDSWNREEVAALCEKAAFKDNTKIVSEGFDKWIEENL